MNNFFVFFAVAAQIATSSPDGPPKTFATMKAQLLAEQRPKSNFGDPLRDPLNESDVQESLRKFAAGSSDAKSRARVAELSAAMRPIYDALPKDENGLLSYQASRYAMHRFLLREHGWFIRGLEATHADAVHSNSSDSEWLVSYLQGLVLENSGAVNVQLSELTVMVATIEDLIYTDIKKILSAVYIYLGMSLSEPETKKRVHCAYVSFMYYMVSFDIIDSMSDWDPFYLQGDLTPRERVHKLCELDNGLLSDLTESREEFNEWSLRVMSAVGDKGDRLMSFSQASGFAIDFVNGYRAIQDLDCHDLQGVLVGMEGGEEDKATPGLVDFDTYRAKKEYRDWRFQESVENLSQAALLDTLSPAPRIVIPNYIGSRLNCVESSSLYATCCQVKCDDYLSQLELRLAAPTGAASDIASFVATLLPGDGSEATRLPDELLHRLTLLANIHGGAVPIHGEAFAMWLHQVFPRDCPQVHPEASSNFPLTAAEWLHEDGEPWDGDLVALMATDSSGSDTGLHIANPGVLPLLLLVVILCAAWCQLRSMQGGRGVQLARRIATICILGVILGVALLDGISLGMLLAALFSSLAAQSLLRFFRSGLKKKKTKACCEDMIAGEVAMSKFT